MNKKVRFIMDAAIIILLIVFDQFTKHLSVKYLKDLPALSLIDGVLELDYLENHGVAFGMLQGKQFLILLVSMICMAAILFMMLKMPKGRNFTILHIIFSCIIAGGIGNMIDRFAYGYVVDFISFVLINYPIFNVADCYVVCGVIAMAIVFLFVLKEEDLDFISFKKKEK